MLHKIKKTLVISFAIVSFLSTPVSAVPLTGSGPHLLIPTINPGIPSVQAPVIAYPSAGAFTGTWSVPVSPDWTGTFNGVGDPFPAVGGPLVSAFYDFTTLDIGYLPTLTSFLLGDLDFGSATNEKFIFTAMDVSGNPITNPWLEEVSAVWGSSTIVSSSMPAWDFNNGIYTFDGTGIAGNPNIGLELLNNTMIYTMNVERFSTYVNFYLRAPVSSVPLPPALAMFLPGLLLMLRWGSKKTA